MAGLVALMLGATAQRPVSEEQKRLQEAKETGGEKLARYKAELYAKLKGKDEQVYLDVADKFYSLGMEKTSDSIQNVIKKKFPRGILVRNTSLTAIYNEKDPVKAEALYKSWSKRFPPEKLGKDIVYDYARMSVGCAYAEKGNAEKAMEYARMLETKMWRGEGWAAIAQVLTRQKKPEQAAELYRMGIDNCEQLQKEGDAGALRFAMIGYPAYLSSCAALYMQLGRRAEALELMEKVPAERRDPSYAMLLSEAGRPLEAFICYNEMLRTGRINEEMLAKMKQLYVQLNGSDKGLEAHIEGIRAARAAQLQKQVRESMISEPAPDFTLTDTEGNTVRLSDLRGKVVVLDFWATWCGPCKRSFPAMQKAVDKYRNDPEVVFLFIHTWERDANATELAMKYLSDNNYRFRLLMDLKDPQTKANTVVKSYGVKGIPAKFVIDPQGNIRFKVTGASGSDDEIVAELSQMIELARKGNQK